MRKYSLREQLVKEKKRRNKIFLFIVVSVMIFLSYSFFFGDMGYLKYKKLKQNEQKLLKEINEISAENTAIKNEINLLKNNPSYLEKYSREKFGLVKQGEMVFQFQKEDR
ncbi:MAG TPA: septum formation initiator family protein [Thermodesulfovibrio thiophilus]|nr:septum formation initiator family protein [Thermodesulfovibrio thiophilus]